MRILNDDTVLTAPLNPRACLAHEDYVVLNSVTNQLVETHPTWAKAMKAAYILNSHERAHGRVEIYQVAHCKEE